MVQDLSRFCNEHQILTKKRKKNDLIKAIQKMSEKIASEGGKAWLKIDNEPSKIKEENDDSKTEVK